MRTPVLCSLILLSCAREPSAPAAVTEAQVQALAPGMQLHSDDAAAVRFPLREGSVTVEAEHFDDPTLEVYKWRHELRLLTPDGVAVVLHVWLNAEHVALQPWFHDTLQFMAEDVDTGVIEGVFTQGKLPGLRVVQARSEQAPSMTSVVIAKGDRVVRVTCIGYEESPEARELFNDVVDGLEIGGKP